jgi:Flp pilus assembly protein CpaB
LIAVVLAGFLALVAGAATVLYVAGSNARAVAGQRAVKVWVTTDAIPRGTTLGAAKAKALLKQESLPARSTPSIALSELGEDTLVAMSDISAGEVLLKGRFGSEESLGPRALTVPTGHVAVSVEVDDPQRVGSFVKPGDFVALFHFDGARARVVFSRVQVLGVGAASEKKKATSDDAANNASTALTLSLTHPEAAQLVATFSAVLNDKEQYLHFALLPANEEVAPQTVAKVATT